MAALTHVQCGGCKKMAPPHTTWQGKPLCAECENYVAERSRHGDPMMKLINALMRGPVPLIKPPPAPANCREKRKEFVKAVMERTKQLGLKAFNATKKLKSVNDFIYYSSKYTEEHPDYVLLIWIDMNVPWCVEWANAQFSQTGEGGVYGLHWVCLYKDNYSKGSFGTDLNYCIRLFESMIQAGGKPAAACHLCSGTMTDCSYCRKCFQPTCGSCRRKWFDKCMQKRIRPSCAFCRTPYELETYVVNGAAIKKDLKKK